MSIYIFQNQENRQLASENCACTNKYEELEKKFEELELTNQELNRKYSRLLMMVRFF